MSLLRPVGAEAPMCKSAAADSIGRGFEGVSSSLGRGDLGWGMALSGAAGGPPWSVQPWESLAGAGLRPETHVVRRGFGRSGAQAQGASRLPRAWAGKADPGLSGGWSCLGVCPCLCPWRLGQCGMVALPFACHLTMDLASKVAQAPPPILPAVKPLLLTAPGSFLTNNSCPLPGSTLQTPLSSTQPPSSPGNTQIWLGHSKLWHIPCM